MLQPVVTSSIDQSTLLDTHSTDFDTGIGPRVLIGFSPNACESWSVNYFSAFDFDGHSSISSPGELAAPGSLGQQGTDWSFADEMSIHYTSEINNVEINHMRTGAAFRSWPVSVSSTSSENYNITTISRRRHQLLSSSHAQ